PWTRAVDQYLREFRPHLIHANNSVTVNWPAARAARRWGIPAIAHQKGFEYPGRLSRWLVTHGGFTHHIATSGAIAQQLYSLGLPPQRCTTIYEPVSGPADDAWDRPRDNPIPVVGMHSVLGHWKGQHVVLQALAEVIRRNRTPVALEIAGAPPAGETDYLDSLHRLVADLGIEKHVRFVGHLRDVYAFLSRVDFAVHASVDPEPFGRVVAEAMLCGLPVIVTTQGGPAEYIEDGVSGCHVPCGDVRATADAIERLAASADLRRRMGRAARQFAVREFEPRRLTEQVVDVYDRVLDRPRALEAGPSDMNPGSYDRLRATR
ncbi:MAG TPA: glycosyltransferase family 4 protein, partial [Lacipirellulaceae bacterium]|nr:glycosyltransferase family 4 protein [Lacipirellulaceae bacterium]